MFAFQQVSNYFWSNYGLVDMFFCKFVGNGSMSFLSSVAYRYIQTYMRQTYINTDILLKILFEVKDPKMDILTKLSKYIFYDHFYTILSL